MNEKNDILLKYQKMETRFEDLNKMHDRKTDMIGKLGIKNFMLISELERLHGSI